VDAAGQGLGRARHHLFATLARSGQRLTGKALAPLVARLAWDFAGIGGCW
jgi:hypothetical protein